MKTLGNSARIIRHYIELAMRSGGVRMTSEMQGELNGAFEAFEDVDARIKKLEDQVTALAQVSSSRYA